MDERLKVFYELYDRRKSVREFAERPVEAALLDRLPEAFFREYVIDPAPFRQPWHFIVLGSVEERGRVNDILTKEGFRKAPLLIVACADPAQAWTRKTDKVNYSWVDVTIAITEMIGAATAEGLGACWIASLDAVEVKRRLDIPDQIEIVAIIAMGYPKEELKKEEKARKPLGEIIHYGKW